MGTECKDFNYVLNMEHSLFILLRFKCDTTKHGWFIFTQYVQHFILANVQHFVHANVLTAVQEPRVAAPLHVYLMLIQGDEGKNASDGDKLCGK